MTHPQITHLNPIVASTLDATDKVRVLEVASGEERQATLQQILDAIPDELAAAVAAGDVDTLATAVAGELADSGWTPSTGTGSKAGVDADAVSAYSAQDISASPTEAEVQAIDDQVDALTDQVIALSQAVKALQDALEAAGLLTA